MQRISYQSIDLKSPVRVFRGRSKVSSVEAVVGGTKIFRVFDGPLDFFIVEGPQAVKGVEIEASNVAASIRSPEPSVTGKGGKSKRKRDEVDPDELAGDGDDDAEGEG